MKPVDPTTPLDPAETLARLERRLARVELLLGLNDERLEETHATAVVATASAGGGLEMAVGQSLFSRIGIAALAVGAALALSLPWNGLSQIVPSAGGWLLALGLFLLAWRLDGALPLIAGNFRAAGMALLFFATLRLGYFGSPPLLTSSSIAAAAALALAAAANFAIAWARRSVLLTAFALLTGLVAALAVGTPWYVFGMVTAVVVAAALVAHSRDWPWLLVVASPAAFLTYLIWALGNPVFGNRLEVMSGPIAGIWFLAGWMAIHAVAMMLRHGQAEKDEMAAQVGAVLNAMGYGLFFLHTLIAYGDVFIGANAAVSIVLLGIAVMLRLRGQSGFATFVYAMTGYGALTMALIRAIELPDLFVWLSLQSLLVISTAIWFRSRFIIVANFMIYLAVVGCYMVMAKDEDGISVGLGMVALISAGVLKWQKHRLELKTELMRNAYLISAFFIFPHALYHIVPGAWVAPSWVALAMAYYGLCLLRKSPKYRWMGHSTLLLTVAYLLFIGIESLQGMQRIVSLLVLGSVLLVVSIVFTWIKARQLRDENAAPNDPTPPPSGGESQ